ncbi:MAG TPA: LLM class flavin-dependent oxidoreductase [Ktedonobacteraceae bacterium]|nr:LLM class flavin-dependent oxidoreductase [Ktedonobacteraceae bacterium]
MRIAANLGPTGNWNTILAATQTAEKLGFDAISFLDHYHTQKLEWPYLCGWSLYGALAMVTSRIHLVPMVIDRMNYLPGVLAKETTMLSIASAGRFELGIGAGDFFEEAHAWGVHLPGAPAHLDWRICDLRRRAIASSQCRLDACTSHTTMDHRRRGPFVPCHS